MSVFKGEGSLSPDFLPPLLPFRESQVRQIASNMEPVSEGGRGQSTFVFGPPGIGKTASVRFVFRQFEEQFPGVKTVYVNCWDSNTSVAVMSRITNDIGLFVPRRGLGKDEVAARFSEAMSKSKHGVVVCLDEVDQLISKEPGALYSLVKGDQTGREVTLVMISNNPHILSRLESRVLSRLSVDEVEFRPYKIGEMKDILAERARLAFKSFDSAAVMMAANHALQKGGDVRVGLQCLQRAGRLAEREGASKLAASHVSSVLKGVSEARPAVVKGRLGAHEKVIVDIVNEDSPLSLSQLYEVYSKTVENPSSLRMVQDYVKHLADCGMLRLSERKVGGKRMIYRF
jgi:cell division control protein 6